MQENRFVVRQGRDPLPFFIIKNGGINMEYSFSIIGVGMLSMLAKYLWSRI
ncbi:hypothetical protein GF312_16260 [Candidatus Poribacteria bacterium]|nr:hypothetical protein [Candidatus Poribacteria bacterium]